LSRFWTPKVWIVLAGLVFGVLAALMTKWGNPPNMGICVACFIRDITGALGLHQASVPKRKQVKEEINDQDC
jgi:hypothetical protein